MHLNVALEKLEGVNQVQTEAKLYIVIWITLYASPA